MASGGICRSPPMPEPGSTDRIRAAATVILWRRGAAGPEVLMGQRGAGAVFMPSKYVFPGARWTPRTITSPLPP